MDRKQYEAIKAKYEDIASWAIWDPDDYDDSTIIEEHIDELTTKFVFVALNISEAVSGAAWKNFHHRHRGGRDYELMRELNDSIYRGAYLTDILKKRIKANSSEIKKLIKKNPQIAQDGVELFLQELKDIGSVDPDIFVFGDVAWSIFVEAPELRKLKIQKMTHYSYRFGKKS